MGAHTVVSAALTSQSHAGVPPTMPDDCPPEGHAGEIADCDCPDFYRITIYKGVAAGETPNKTDVVYEVFGYVDGGNLQIHPPLQ